MQLGTDMDSHDAEGALMLSGISQGIMLERLREGATTFKNDIRQIPYVFCYEVE